MYEENPREPTWQGEAGSKKGDLEQEQEQNAGSCIKTRLAFSFVSNTFVKITIFLFFKSKFFLETYKCLVRSAQDSIDLGKKMVHIRIMLQKEIQSKLKITNGTLQKNSQTIIFK